MSNIDKRGFKSVTAETARGVIAGFGLHSYLMGLDALLDLVRDGKPAKAKPSAKGGKK
jgi:3-dehydroquinate dehydratase-2